jgi:hypothetical protein
MEPNSGIFSVIAAGGAALGSETVAAIRRFGAAAMAPSPADESNGDRKSLTPPGLGHPLATPNGNIAAPA